MAANEVTGWDPETVRKKKEWYQDHPRKVKDGVPFEDAFCLTNIARQPEDYDGPERVCGMWTKRGRDDFCHNHEHYENLETMAAMKHGVSALQESLVEDFTDREKEAYREIKDHWADHYGIDDPGSMDTLHYMAVEMVREHRADEVLEDDGLSTVHGVYGPEGGLLETEEQAHYLLTEKRAIRNKIQDCKDDLGITRKHQDKMETEQSKHDQLTEISEKVNSAIEGGNYDPSEYDEEDESQDNAGD